MELELKFKVGAPSKVLITGGYLILSPDNYGIVMSLDCNFWIEVNSKWSINSTDYN